MLLIAGVVHYREKYTYLTLFPTKRINCLSSIFASLSGRHFLQTIHRIRHSRCHKSQTITILCEEKKPVYSKFAVLSTAQIVIHCHWWSGDDSCFNSCFFLVISVALTTFELPKQLHLSKTIWCSVFRKEGIFIQEIISITQSGTINWFKSYFQKERNLGVLR